MPKAKKVPTHLLMVSDCGKGQKVPCNNARGAHKFTKKKADVTCKDCKAFMKSLK